MSHIYIMCLFSCFLIGSNNIAKAQETTQQESSHTIHQESLYSLTFPKRETRAVWLTTISGLDWPKAKANSLSGIEQQKAELTRILDQYKRANINTVILQTRIRGTVIYPSAIEPWDDCLTGTPGKNPGYDPLEFCIDECHRRGMELHAWIVSIPLGKRQSSYGASSITKRHKELCRTAGGECFMIPGRPATADYIASLCKEIVEKYDVDGISLDYIRYPESLYRFSDDDCYPKSSSMSKNEWRRDNISRIVRAVHDAVKPIKPWVKLSSSPIGKYDDLSRYSSKGWNCYSAVYQDPQLWLRNDWQDMLFPMMYFLGDHFYPFLFDWRENANGHPVIPGLGIYFLDPREGKWTLNEVRAEMHTARNSGIGGMAFYRGAFLTRNCKGVYDAACEEFFPYPALTSRMTWMGDTIAPVPPRKLSYKDGRVMWQHAIMDKEVLYNVYGSNLTPVDVTKPENLLAVNVRDDFFELHGRALKCRYIAVTSIDRFGNESAPVQLSN